jgi:hypothetical protein
MYNDRPASPALEAGRLVSYCLPQLFALNSDVQTKLLLYWLDPLSEVNCICSEIMVQLSLQVCTQTYVKVTKNRFEISFLGQSAGARRPDPLRVG